MDECLEEKTLETTIENIKQILKTASCSDKLKYSTKKSLNSHIPKEASINQLAKKEKKSSKPSSDKRWSSRLNPWTIKPDLHFYNNPEKKTESEMFRDFKKNIFPLLSNSRDANPVIGNT